MERNIGDRKEASAEAINSSVQSSTRRQMPAAFFRTIEPPTLHDASNKSLYLFRIQWKNYECRISEAKRQGIDAREASVISCIDPSLLQPLLRFELGVGEASAEEQASK